MFISLFTKKQPRCPSCQKFLKEKDEKNITCLECGSIFCEPCFDNHIFVECVKETSTDKVKGQYK